MLTDPKLAASEPVAVTLDALRGEGLDAVLFDRVRIEPTDASFAEAIEFATDGRFDGYVAVGGGSVIDTAKAANLYAVRRTYREGVSSMRTLMRGRSGCSQ